MHLLQVEANGDFSLKVFYGKQIPQYAILSHTWIADHEEVTFKDIIKGKGKTKIGYQKLHFIAKQAAADGLKYFWVDTCCIDKASSAELQEAINSMFRWYQKSAKCYVYLSDVSSVSISAGGLSFSLSEPWKLAFLQSKWFTRGWTLQELLAPQSVQFFSAEGGLLGDKLSLWSDIEMITKIPLDILQGSYAYLLAYDVSKRLSWAADRKTTREEDAAYSLLGLFDLHMPLLYGEGRTKAFMRLHRERESMPNYEQSPGHATKHVPVEIPSLRNQPDESRVQKTPLQASLKRTAGEDLRESAITKKQSIASPPPAPEAPDIEMVEATDLEIAEAPQDVFQIPTHPLSNKVIHADIRIASEPYQIEDITSSAGFVSEETSMKMWWNDSIARHLNTPDDYTQVAVLLIKWADELDELYTQHEVQEVERLFRDRFRFRTEILELNVQSKPQHQLNQRMASFIVDNDGPNNLLIVYYSGLSMYRDLENYLELTASMNLYRAKGFRQDAHANWNKAEDILRSEDTDADVLTIMDTSFAANSVQGRTNTSHAPPRITKAEQARRFEMMSAAGIDETTSAPGDSSFTRAFIDNLINLLEEKDGKPISTFRLNQRICMDERRRSTPSQVIQVLPHNGHIVLKPLKPGHVQRYEMFRARTGARLTLSFELRDKTLSQQQIEFLARGLAHTFRDNQAIGLRKIHWQGMDQVEQSPAERLALAKDAIAKWKDFVRRRRETSLVQRQIDAVP